MRYVFENPRFTAMALLIGFTIVGIIALAIES